MSRTRIVKGKIIEKVGGDYKLYSNEGIKNYATEAIYQEGVEEGVSYGEPEKPKEGEIIAKCLVKFRPHDNYKDNPDFGFDWLREGDSGQAGDNWFGGVMGKYYEEATFKTPFKNTNSWSKFFLKDMNMYDRKLKSYTSFSIGWKTKDKKPFLYPIPTLTLLKGKTAIFNLKIEIKNKPKKITFEFKDAKAKDYLTLNINEIGDIKEGKYDKFNYFKITCNKEFSSIQTLYVKADDEICGAMKIHPNSEKFVKHEKILFVNVKTNINGILKIGKPAKGGMLYFKQLLNQTLIVTHIEHLTLDCTDDTYKSYCIEIGGKFYFNKSSDLKRYLEKTLKSKHGEKYSDYYKAFFIDDVFPKWKDLKIIGYTNGFSYFNTKFTIQFKTHSIETIPHEMMHALSLAHTFDAVSTQALFKYKAKKTNNIMDYSHHDGIKRIVLYKWQWKLVNTKILE